jgi:hypothetical protein
MGTVFIDHPLRMFTFAHAAPRIINLMSVDIGRPTAYIAFNAGQLQVARG